ncbi:MAG: GntR family transcriptional regulator [Vannielia sp.]|uniref:GntR family transcriptional regulator n=1 Tax=Rhodobacterales TaxID=204455 RepID=UPI002096100D|nr:GntR family transcriptional regulator [Oceanicola sp. 502str15]MCO6384396.1 FCD domain-containing protein [Oceanicola sp. 502str15]
MAAKTFTHEHHGETTGERSLRRIRFDIMQGTLAPGQKLKLERLRETYDTSVTTLREILNRLAVEGFVIAEGQRGFEVSPVSLRDLRDISELRLLLERHALRRSVEVGDIEWEARVVSTYHKLHSVETQLVAGEEVPVSSWVQYDWDFHHAIISACDSPALMASHSGAFDRYMRYHLLALSFRGADVARQHEALRDLVLARDIAGAEALLTDHVMVGRDHVARTGRFDD